MFISRKWIVPAMVCTSTVALAQGPGAAEIESETKTVTVYLSGARETRQASAKVNAGEQQLLLTGLPQHLNPATLRVGASDWLQIVSINHRLNYTNATDDDHAELKQLKDSVEFYTEQVKLKEGVYNSLQGTKSMILSNKSVKGETQGMESEDLSDLLDFYREKLNDINTKSLALERQLETMRNTRDRFTREYQNQLSGKSKTYSEIQLTVRARQAGKASLSIEFFTPDAGWVPQYDIRNKGTKEELEITNHATLWQKTGYDWKNISITLSTLDPSFNIDAPELAVKTLSIGGYNQRTYNAGRYDQYKASILADSSKVYYSSDRKVVRGGSWKDVSQYLNTSSETGPGIEYKIAAPYSIASNGKDIRIEIDRKMVAASFKYKTVPKVEKAVFLMAVITGWDTLNYYPGNANIFNNGTFVGTVYLNTAQVQDSLELSLGQDKSFSVEYEIMPDKTTSATSGSTYKKARGYMIKIMNKKNEDVSVEVMDQAPISTNQEVSVEVDKGDGENDPLTGFITWRRKIAAGQKVEIPISYIVKYPKDHNLYNF